MNSKKSSKFLSENPKKVEELSKLAATIEGNGFLQIILRQSISELIYIIEKVEELLEPYRADLASLSDDEVKKMFKQIKHIRFYSQCLLLWGFRILEIIEKTAGLKIPLDIRIARNILAAHYGISRGKLKNKLGGKNIIIDVPKISPNGNLTYNLSSLGGPSSLSSEKEVLKIRNLYRKYVKPAIPNTWEMCHEILCQTNVKITKKDQPIIEAFLRNNGGVFTTSHRILNLIIDSLKKYSPKTRC